MSDVNTKDLHPEIWKLFDRYVHGLIDRRGFLDGAAKYTAGSMTAVGILEALRPNYAEAQIQVAPTDSRIKTEKVEIKSPNGNGMIRALLARPAASTGRLPAVVVIHENRGLNPHIEDVVRRAAVAGFMAIGPDALTSTLDLARRLSRHRRSGRRNAAEARTAEDDGRFHCHRAVREGPA